MTNKDGRLDNPQTFKRDPAKGDQPLEETPIHILKRVRNNKTGKWGDKWCRTKLGVRRLNYIRNNPINMNLEQLAEHLKMSTVEVFHVRCLIDPEYDRARKVVKQKSEYQQYQDDLYSVYDEQPLGAKAPIHTEHYYDAGADINDRRNMPVRQRTIREYGYRY